MTAQDDHRDLEELGEKLREVEAKRATRKGYERPDDDMPNTGIGVGLRIGTELVVGVMVGAAIGWSFDRALGTEPWGFLVFFVLGFVGGIMNVIRSANKAMANTGADGDNPDAQND
jgi:ATP synthase protein I